MGSKANLQQHVLASNQRVREAEPGSVCAWALSCDGYIVPLLNLWLNPISWDDKGEGDLGAPLPLPVSEHLVLALELHFSSCFPCKSMGGF